MTSKQLRKLYLAAKQQGIDSSELDSILLKSGIMWDCEMCGSHNVAEINNCWDCGAGKGCLPKTYKVQLCRTRKSPEYATIIVDGALNSADAETVALEGEASGIPESAWERPPHLRDAPMEYDYSIVFVEESS